MNNWRLLLSISKTHLLSKLKQTIIAALGVTFGIATFIIMMSFMTGLNQLLDGLVLNRTPHVRIFNDIKPSETQVIQMVPEYKDATHVIHSIKPKKNIARIHNALPLIHSLLQDKRVRGICPQATAKVFYVAGSIELNGMITGVEVEKEIDLFNFDDYIPDGDPVALNKINNGILLGAGLAKNLSLSVNDNVQIINSKGSIVNLKIVGIFQSGLAEIDNIQSYVNLKTAQTIMGEGSNYISDINVKLFSIDDAPTMTKEIEKTHQVNAIDIQTANAQFETGTDIRNMITYAVSIALLIVAGFGIYNILNMLIYEKMNDIAILKATGFSGSDVKKIFISQAMIIGTIGGALGLLIGFLVSLYIDQIPFVTEALPTIDTFPVNFQVSFYITGILFALVSTFIAGYMPAKKAEKIDPIEIIRSQ